MRTCGADSSVMRDLSSALASLRKMTDFGLKVMPSTILEKDQAQLQRPNLETRLRAYGEKIFDLIEQADSPSLFSKKGFYGTLMEWAMKDEHFKTQLFRFLDVLPTLTSASAIARHLKEYLGEDQVNLSPALRLGL